MKALALAIPALLIGLAPAQGRTWVVDQNGGPGTDFPDLPAAVAQAASGDRVVVRAGTYTGFTTGKGLTILGEGTVHVFRLFPIPPRPVIEIAGLARGEALVMRNIHAFASHGGIPTVALVNCRGRVHFEDVRVDARNAFTQTPTGLGVVDCDCVTITRGRLDGWPAARSARSLLTLTGVAVVGGSASNSPRGATLSGSGISLSDSILWSSRTDVRGGDGSLLFPHASIAIAATNSELTLTGDATTAVIAGGGGLPTPAVQTNGGRVVADTLIRVSGSAGGSSFAGTATLVHRRVAALQAGTATIGALVSVELDAPAGDPIALFAGSPGDAVFAPEGILFLDPATVVPLWIGPQAGNGRSRWSFPVPPNATLRGVAITFQGARADVVLGAIELTNPAVAVID